MDQTNKPLAAEIMLYKRSIIDGHADIVAMCSTTSDIDGKYRCGYLKPGSYAVAVRILTPFPSPSESGPAVQKPGTTRYPLTYYPDVHQLAEAELLGLRDGGSVYAPIRVAAMAAAPLKGEVPGHPRTVALSIQSHSDGFDLPTPFPGKYDSATGLFTFDSVPDGVYRVTLDWSNGGEDHHAATVVDLKPGSNRVLEIRELRSTEATGKVRFDDSMPHDLPSSVSLISIDNVNDPITYRSSVSADGAFEFHLLPEGRYRLQTVEGEKIYIRNVFAAGKEMPRQSITLSTAQASVPLDVVLGETAASVTGTLEGANRLAGTSGVVLESVDDSTIVKIPLDGGGRFYLNNARPGEYRVYAWTDMSNAEYRNPAYLARFRAKSKSLIVDDKCQCDLGEVLSIEMN